MKMNLYQNYFLNYNVYILDMSKYFKFLHKYKLLQKLGISL